jgi:hypothetical protein
MTPPRRTLHLDPAWARSVPAQMGLLAATFAGAIVLALVTLGLRALVFERYVRETYPPSTEHPRALVERLESALSSAGKPAADADELADGPADPQTVALREAADWDALYALWMTRPAGGPGEQRLRTLLWSRPAATLERIRGTSVVGNLAQRSRALELLASVPASHSSSDALRLCRYVRERARRRGEHDLFTRADRVLQSLIKPT